jgi:hypothetical protein
MSKQELFNISNNTGHSEKPQIIYNDNKIYVSWIDDTPGSRDIFFRKSSDNGCTFGPLINVGIGEGGSIDPRMAISGNNIYLIWEHSPKNNGEIYFTRSVDNGASFEKARNLGNSTGLNGYPQVVANGDNVYVVWHDATNGISFTRSVDNGASFEKARNLGNSTASNGHPQIMSQGTNLYVAWVNNSPQHRGQIIFTRSIDNGASFEVPYIIHEVANEGLNGTIFQTRIASDSANKNIFLIWQSGRIVEHARVQARISDIFFTRSTNNGASFGKIVNLSNYSGIAADPQIAVSQNNNVYVVWTNNPQEKYGQTYLRMSANNGASFGKIVNLSNYSGIAADPQIAVSQNNNVYVVWTSNSTINEEVFFKRHNDIENDEPCKMQDISSSSNKSTYLHSDNRIDYKTPSSLNIAIVRATFTDAAYDKSLYMFYEIYEDQIKKSDNASFSKYTDLLSSRITKNPANWSGIDQIVNHLKWLTPNSNIDVLGDQDIDNGTLLFNQKGANNYDVIILEHQEYVSQKEYDNLRKYVSGGGLLVLLAGNVFFGEVEYDQSTNTITLAKGHGFTFDGESAWRSDRERWAKENTEWVGSNYKCCFEWEFTFHNDPFGITHVEEQYITNPRAEILLDYNATAVKSKEEFTIATYMLEYKKGAVITLGIWTVNKLFENERFLRFFDSLMFQYAFRQR